MLVPVLSNSQLSPAVQLYPRLSFHIHVIINSNSSPVRHTNRPLLEFRKGAGHETVGPGTIVIHGNSPVVVGFVSFKTSSKDSASCTNYDLLLPHYRHAKYIC